MTDPETRSGGRQSVGDVEPDGGLSPLDRVLEALSRETDRYILYYLTENEAVELDDLVDGLVTSETDQPPSAVSEELRREICIELHHERLPRLEDLGIVEYDHRTGAVRYRNPPQHLREFLELARELEDQ